MGVFVIMQGRYLNTALTRSQKNYRITIGNLYNVRSFHHSIFNAAEEALRYHQRLRFKTTSNSLYPEWYKNSKQVEGHLHASAVSRTIIHWRTISVGAIYGNIRCRRLLSVSANGILDKLLSRMWRDQNTVSFDNLTTGNKTIAL